MIFCRQRAQVYTNYDLESGGPAQEPLPYKRQELLKGDVVDARFPAQPLSRLILEEEAQAHDKVPAPSEQQQDALPAGAAAATAATNSPHGDIADANIEPGPVAEPNFLQKYRETRCNICDKYIADEQSGNNVAVRKLPCGHVFHDQCLWKWMVQVSASCPTCDISYAQ